jgi:hypothetical protein
MSRGFRILPIKPPRRDEAQSGKAPMSRHGVHDATDDLPTFQWRVAAALVALPVAGPANAGAYSDNTTDIFVSPPRIVTHRVWSPECDPANGGPYFVGYDSGDQTVQIKTPHGRPYAYAARAEQVGPGVARVSAIRHDQNHYLVITIAGDSSSLQAIGQNAGGAPGGTDFCHVINGWDWGPLEIKRRRAFL